MDTLQFLLGRHVDFCLELYSSTASGKCRWIRSASSCVHSEYGRPFHFTRYSALPPVLATKEYN